MKTEGIGDDGKSKCELPASSSWRASYIDLNLEESTGLKLGASQPTTFAYKTERVSDAN
jgi:hypothetical protein